MLLRESGPVVLCLARNLAARTRREYRQPLAQGRSALASPYLDRPRRPDAKTTAYRNRLVAAPGGKTEQLCREVLT